VRQATARVTAVIDASRFLMNFFIIIPSFQILELAFSCGRNQNVHLLYERPAKLDWKKIIR
jgi:hypothetical protein